MDKKVTPEQMEQLFAFTRKHYVEYYDLQCKLADHLANAIEQQWVTEPNIDFQTQHNSLCYPRKGTRAPIENLSRI